MREPAVSENTSPASALEENSASTSPAIARVSINLPLKVWEALEEMAKCDQITRTEALRRSISTELYMWKARRSGAQVLVEQPDKSVVSVVFPW
jgi:Ribbon-helix-helix protein, copG family